MRNLKKILALVLALVMSLSLMAVASADDELNLGDVNEIYAESVDVLTGLKVFQGNKGEFLPKDNITRAEVAAIIYRIVTGDVEDTQKSIYADYNKFSDVTSDAWYAGYVNYCANAEYVKGVGGGKFAPQQNVTGYEALAMILRAIGYDKNNEFTGSNWQIQTAATARNRGILKNIAEGTLGGAASREVVAEILCQTILVPVADYSLAFGYRTTDANGKDNETLAYKTFKMEKIEGIVMANYYADLEKEGGNGITKDGTTRLKTEDGSYVLEAQTNLDDIGESRYTYVVPATGSRNFDLVTSNLYDTGLNNTTSTGDKRSKLADALKDEDAGISLTTDTDTEHFLNFDRVKEFDKHKSEFRIEYTVTFTSADLNRDGDKTDANETAIAIRNAFVGEFVGYADADRKVPLNLISDVKMTPATAEASMNTTDGPMTYTKVIQVDGTITKEDMGVIQGIFYRGDDSNYSLGIDGSVFVGSTSNQTTLPSGIILHNGDVSDTMSYNDFLETYINTDLAFVTGNEKGNWLKVVDNNNDNVAEYVLKTATNLDQIIAKNGSTDEYKGLGATSSSNVVVYLDENGHATTRETAVGDVVVTATIDKKTLAVVSETVTSKINSVSFANKTATGEDGTVYYQSEIGNKTALPEVITDMNERTEYKMYKDYFGWVRAYDGPDSDYGLLTEIYPSNRINSTNNGSYIQNRTLVAELMAGADSYPAEYNVLNSYSGAVSNNINHGYNIFYDTSLGNNGWNSPLSNQWGITPGTGNWLHRAVGELGVTRVDNTTQLVTNVGDKFFYDNNTATEAVDPDDYSFTNVAKYSKTDDGVYLYSAAEYMRNTAGEQLFYADIYVSATSTWSQAGDGIFERYTQKEFVDTYNRVFTTNTGSAVFTAGLTKTYPDRTRVVPVYAVDYIQLDVQNIAKGASQYAATDSTYAYAQTHLPAYNRYVNATHDTEYFLVDYQNAGVRHFTDYVNLPAIGVDDIRAIYSVAKNTSADSATTDYWVAEVVVIELNKSVYSYDSIDLVYGNPSETSGTVRELSALNSEVGGDAKLTLHPNQETWGSQWGNTQYGFYAQYRTTATGEGSANADISPLTANFNRNGVFAGQVERIESVYAGGGYLVVNMVDDLTGTNPVNNQPYAPKDFTDLAGVKDVTPYRLQINGQPIYTLTLNSSGRGYSLTTRTLDNYTASRVNEGDHVIWVCDRTGALAYVVDLTRASGSTATMASHLENTWQTIITEQWNNEYKAAKAESIYGQAGNTATFGLIKADDPRTLVVSTEAGTTIESVTLYKNGVAQPNPVVDYKANRRTATITIGEPDRDNTVTWTVNVVTSTNGKVNAPETITFTQNKLNAVNALTVKDNNLKLALVRPATGDPILVVEDDSITLETLAQYLYANGDDIKVEGFDPADNLRNKEDVMSKVAWVRVTVTNTDGVETVYTFDNRPVSNADKTLTLGSGQNPTGYSRLDLGENVTAWDATHTTQYPNGAYVPSGTAVYFEGVGTGKFDSGDLGVSSDYDNVNSDGNAYIIRNVGTGVVDMTFTAQTFTKPTATFAVGTTGQARIEWTNAERTEATVHVSSAYQNPGDGWFHLYNFASPDANGQNWGDLITASAGPQSTLAYVDGVSNTHGFKWINVDQGLFECRVQSTLAGGGHTTYTFRFATEHEKSPAADIVTIHNVAGTKGGSTGSYTYAVTLPAVGNTAYDKLTADNITVSAGATVQIVDSLGNAVVGDTILGSGANTVYVKVVAENGIETEIYTVTITR